MITREIFVCHPIAISGLRSAHIKKLKKTDPHFFEKWGSVFFNFLILELLRPQIAIRRCTNFSHMIFSGFWPLKIKTSGKKLYGHNPLRMLNHIGFWNFKKVEFWLKNRHFKMFSKNSVSSTQSATLEIWLYLSP